MGSSLFMLNGKVAVVLGAGGGLGRAMAVALASGGAEIAAIGKSIGPVEQTCQEVQK